MQLTGIVWSWLSLLQVAAAAAGTTAANLSAIFDQSSYQWDVNTVLVLPNDTSFANLTERWTLFDAPSFAGAIRPATEADVAQVVQLARQNNLPFLATGGRHGFTTTLEALDQGLEIDLSQLDTVEVDDTNATLTIGAGVIVNDILDPIYDAGFEMRKFTCSCPGVLGITLGGGIGRYTGKYGLTIDALLSVNFVTADGRLLHVSNTSYPDLFWAIRGAGHNFGIVTSATYQLQRIADSPEDRGEVMLLDLLLPPNMSLAYFELVESYQANGSLPANLAQITSMGWDTTTNQPHVLGDWVFMGSEEEGRELLAPVYALNPTTISTTMVPWNEILSAQGFGEINAALCQKNQTIDYFGVTFRNYSASTYQTVFEKLTNLYNTIPDTRGSTIQVETFSNIAQNAVPHNSTAYPWRDALGHVAFVFNWEDPNSGAQEAVADLGPELRDILVATSGYDSLACYVNYANGDESPEAWYSQEKLPQLVALKAEWDPDHVFSYYNPIPASYP
ncbi:FAD-binding domain-containing protein [Cryphonectria parasitica EP155]|uniref:FAD-binding domain-containing protein n=1 Tax=Cryphonectria parasitica (strain ATCC 38755 / EP155) TaxID=660469 RepID=A0A9P4Y535_CRYP1|nr:FAD-binding domain-containing protein [Cryphonectria parasitica EP155]KAF3766676.1 FAD-binding domain-containing protein [Cryphonectria parasitica EP155]